MPLVSNFDLVFAMLWKNCAKIYANSLLIVKLQLVEVRKLDVCGSLFCQIWSHMLTHHIISEQLQTGNSLPARIIEIDNSEQLLLNLQEHFY